MRAGLLEDLQALGFGIVGYGCTTCIGNSGPLTEPIEQAINERDATPVAVLSGNRNFPGRVHPKLIAGFLASPPMVIAFALAGDVNRNILTEPIGKSFTGAEIHLSDIWPTGAEIDAALGAAHSTGDYALSYAQAEASETWKELNAPTDPLFPWDANSTYIRRPPFAAFSTSSRLGLYTAHPLAVFGDDVTTDHISPAGQIAKNSDAAQWLIEHGADGADLNVYAARRGNWEVMLRGLFMNKSVRNLLGSEIPAGFTIHANSGECLPIWRAAQRYENEGASVVIVAGHRYGMGSSRDWAAKGAALLGVRAVLASSFERIHRSNLINMGILPLKLPVEQNPKTLALKAGDQVEVSALAERLSPRVGVGIQITRQVGENQAFTATAALETSLEVETLKAGGLLPMILRNIASRA
jgi:aconitate hydratase